MESSRPCRWAQDMDDNRVGDRPAPGLAAGRRVKALRCRASSEAGLRKPPGRARPGSRDRESPGGRRQGFRSLESHSHRGTGKWLDT